MTSNAVVPHGKTSLRRLDDRGAALMETALVTPVLFAFFLGIFEFGLIYRDVLTSSSAVRDTTRIGAVIGPRPVDTTGEGDFIGNGDFAMISRLRQGLSSMSVDSIDRIVIFRGAPGGAGSAVSQVPAACKTGSGGGFACNIYDARDAFEAVENGDAEYFCGASGPSCGWEPDDRENGPRPQDVDYIGVYVRVVRPYVSGMFGDTFTFESAHVMRLEAGVFTDE